MKEEEAQTPELTEPSSPMSSRADEPSEPVTPQPRESAPPELVEIGFDKRLQRLKFLVERSKVYSNILKERLAVQEAEQGHKDQDKEQEPATRKSPRKPRGRGQQSLLAFMGPKGDKAKPKTKNQTETEDAKTKPESNADAKVTGAEGGALKPRLERYYKQSKYLTGGTLHEYQLAGVEWLVSLFENGLNGILADEMGLGKTIQVIGFLAYLIEWQVTGPFLIVGPLSTIENWTKEFAKFAPELHVVKYHGTPSERDALRRREFRDPSKLIVVTSYEIVLRDAKHLGRFDWKYVIVDEGHRLKNINSRLMQELKKLSSANRLLLTGTPLQNNLAELWSLLNFLLPDVFTDLALFQTWFESAESDASQLDEDESAGLIASLHSILRPFLLRRLKSDVDQFLPDKREYVIYGPLAPAQTELYQHILSNTAREYVVNKILEARGHEPRSAKRKASSLSQDAVDGGQPAKRLRSRIDYTELEDDEFIAQALGQGFSHDVSTRTSGAASDVDELDERNEETDLMIKQAERETRVKSFQNVVMQLRLACNSPYLFYYPWSYNQRVDKRLVTDSGKMTLLDKLATKLVKDNHKILIFSQFTKMLDILEDWVGQLKKWRYCRIDGSTAQTDRQDAMETFNSDDRYKVFLLSTRSGGLGINLTAADTVILFDSDWNPQQDLQAMDRVHRIGQTRPVIVYRLATASTVEESLLQRASSKRRLGHLIIEKGRFKGFATRGLNQEAELERLNEELRQHKLRTKNMKSGGISDRDMKTILDRSDDAYIRARNGVEGLSDNISTVI